MNESNESMDTTERPTTSSKSINSSFPSEIYLFKLIESHSLEINSLNTECKTKSPKLLSQRLPRFMRRRASSHNPKRIPKSIRQSVIDKTIESRNTSKVQKNKKRKKFVNKRKHELSIKRRNNRSERSVLHVWFAKRFKMRVHWNCLIPEKNCTKNERNLYHNSKNDCIFHYLSFYNCIEIDYSLCDRQQLISCLNQFTHSDIGCTFGAKIYESGNREGITVLYNSNSYPLEPLVSSDFLWNQSFSKLWLWVHIVVYDKVLQLLTDFSQKKSNNFKINGRKGRLERFRLIGPKAHLLLSKCLKFDFCLNLDEINDNSVHYCKYNLNITSLMTSNETNLFKDIQELNPKKKSSDNFDFILVVKNNSFKNRFTTDLIVLSESAKNLWHKITENRSHKTGGLHDLRSIALNTSSLLFPEFGFIDVKENETKAEKLKSLLNVKSEKPFYIIRNESLISKLYKSMNSLAINFVLDSLEDKDNVLINIEVNCVNRGVPQELDYICIPNEMEIENCFNDSIEESNTREDNLNDRKIIGLIEFGKYSLETSRGKGLGIITITGLEEVIKISEKINLKNKNNKIFASFKSLKSSMYRIVTIKVIDSVFSA